MLDQERSGTQIRPKTIYSDLKSLENAPKSMP